MGHVILFFVFCLLHCPSCSEPVSSFFSPVSFDQDRLKVWETYYPSCKTNPEGVSVLSDATIQEPLLPQLLDQKKNRILKDSKSESQTFQRKTPTPIKLVFDSDLSCSTFTPDEAELDPNCTLYTVDITKMEKALFFDARSPAQDYFVSYYMNRTGFPYHPPGRSPIEFKLNNQIEYSEVRALTISVNLNNQRRQTAFSGLGPIDAGSDQGGKTDLPSYFIHGVFLGTSADIPGFTSHEFQNGKRYPMEIYLYFSKEVCTVPECSTQLVVPVEESDKENEQIKPVIEMLGAGNENELGLFMEEVKFISKYDYQGLRELPDDLYEEDMSSLWNTINMALERVHLGHAYRLVSNDLFERRKGVEQQFTIAELNLIQKCPFYNKIETNSTVHQFTKNQTAIEEFSKIYDGLQTKVKELVDKVQGPRPSGILSTADASDVDWNTYADFQQKWTNSTSVLLESIDELMEELTKPGLNISGVSFPATQALRLPKIQGQQLTYTYYATNVVAHRKRDVSNFAQSVVFNDVVDSTARSNKTNNWKEVLEVLPEYYLIAINDISEFVSKKLQLLQKEARNSVPRLQLQKDFQISWLIPSFGGHYEYTGSTPFPPCHQTMRTIVFESPIKMSRSQIQALSRVPTSSKRDEDLTNTRPPFHNIEDLTREFRVIPLIVKHDQRNHQWLGEGDAFHENSIERAKRKKEGRGLGTRLRPQVQVQSRLELFLFSCLIISISSILIG